MNEAEKCGFISCDGIFIMHFSRVSKYPGNHPFLLVMANCHCILDSFPYQLGHMQQTYILGWYWVIWWHQN